MPIKDFAAQAAKSAAAIPVPRSTGQGAMPASSTITAPSSLPPIQKKQKAGSEETSELFAPVYLKQKKHFEGRHEKLAKDRLGERRFGYVRHDCYYKNLAKPENPQSLSWADHKRKEFWRTDVERVLARDEEKRRARQKELLAIWTNQEAWRRQYAQKMRDMKFQAYLAMNERNKKIGCRSNRSGAPDINIITREPIGQPGVSKEDLQGLPVYEQDVAKYKAIARSIFMQTRMSGARNYNIINWMQNPRGPELPPWPEKPPTPPPAPPEKELPINVSKGAVSYGRLFGPFGTFDH